MTPRERLRMINEEIEIYESQIKLNNLLLKHALNMAEITLKDVHLDEMPKFNTAEELREKSIPTPLKQTKTRKKLPKQKLRGSKK